MREQIQAVVGCAEREFFGVTLKKTFRYLSLAALALVGSVMTGCSSDNNIIDEPQQPANKDNIVTLTTTVSLDGGATTRALAEDGTKTFAVGDQIAVCYPISSEPNWAKATSAALEDGDITNGGKSATFTVTLVNPSEGENDLYYCYPAALATIDGYDTNALANQDGTLASISSGLDFCVGGGKWDGTGNLPSVTLHNMFAICKFTVKDAVGTYITNTLTQLTIHETDNYKNFDYTIKPKSATTFGSFIYVAMELPEHNDDITFNFTANSGTGNYTKTITGKTLERGKIYPINLTMNELSGAWDGNLAKISASVLQADCQTVIVPDGTTLTGTPSSNYKITIADGATVTLNNAIINGTNDSNKQWAALTCNGNATIILADGSTNTMMGFYERYPGIFVPSGSTLTIQGTGQLTASSNGYGAGIGGEYQINCGNIDIQGGNITATGGHAAAGIGCGCAGKCGNISISGGTIVATGGTYAAGIGSGTEADGDECGSITISGGTITATGGDDAAGIGSGKESKCGSITITSGVTHVTATKGNYAPNSIGAGNDGTCGTVTIEDGSKVTQN
ncbi:MAG: hypothetical protein J5502_02610 [Prevotella sp.]|nr:hypothetical protein [Prevotella sp.]